MWSWTISSVVLAALAATMLPAGQVQAKGGQTYYTPARIAAGKQNVATYPWAQETLRRIRQGEPHTYYLGRTYLGAEA
jgi:hypothetical protein